MRQSNSRILKRSFALWSRWIHIPSRRWRGHAAGFTSPSARSCVHLIFVGEEFLPAAESFEGALVAPVADLVRMKLTSFRLKDKVHIQDLDGVGLITSEIEAQLPDLLRQRLAEVRASE